MSCIEYNSVLYYIFVIILLNFISITNGQNPQPFAWNEKIMLNRCPRIYPRIFEGFAPIGNLSAGNYSEQLGSRSFNHCVSTCCSSPKCNVVLHHNDTCYHIRCASNELCIPLIRPTQADVKMVLINPTMGQEDESWQEILDQSNFVDQNAFSDQTEDFFNNDQLSSIRNKFHFNVSPFEDVMGRLSSKLSNNQYLDRADLLQRFGDQYINNDDLAMEATDYLSKSFQQCENAIECPKNEDCIGLKDKSRYGICNCLSGFIRNEAGTCVSVDEVQNNPRIDEKSKQAVVSKLNKLSNSTSDTSKTESSTPTLKRLMVSALSKEVRLPENEVSLSAYTIPDAGPEGYGYTWTLVSQPVGGDIGTMTDQTGDTVKLSHLTEGLYKFKVAVTGDNAYGEAFANVTVLPRNRINQAPVVIITPNSQIVKLPNTGAVLDGSTSHDDDGIIVWHWELQQGPLGYQPNLPETPTLQLKDLTSPGNYTFKLTVEDTDHVTNSTTANITVLKVTDYPPEANAGQDVIMYLPHNSITLNGNMSSDDHEIVTWQWTKASSDQSKAVDMQNTRTPYLQLSNLEEGMYTFVLKVTDSGGQTSQAEVHVFVKPPSNKPPIANAGSDILITLPQTFATLNGSASADDDKIVAYFWEELSGPSSADILQRNESIANATHLTKGTYVFKLTVTDNSGNKAYDNVELTVMQTKNTPPVANAGGDQSVTLPIGVIIINGTSSHDDLKIAKWQWIRESGSLATGQILGDMNSPVLMLTEVVAGRYVFRLIVTDGQGLTGEDTVSIIVHPDPLTNQLVEVTLNADAGRVTQSQVESFEQKLELLLGTDTSLHIRSITQELHTGRSLMIFYAEKNDSVTHKSTILSGPDVVHLLKQKLQQDSSLLDLTVVSIRTLVCQDACSGHGVCDPDSRTCMCEAFWMQDYFSKYILGGDSNCDWSILYVVLCVFIIIVVAVGGVACLCHKACHPRPTVNQKYKLLGDQDEIPNFSRSMIAQSDSDTESDVLFESRSKHGRLNGEVIRNGHHKYNGFSKLGRKIKA